MSSSSGSQAEAFSSATEVQPFHPVILGADIGVYNLARGLNEAYGVVPTVLAKMVLGPVSNSRILDLILVDPKKSPVDSLLELTPQIKEQHQGKKLLLLANGDTFVFEITRRAREVSQHYLFAFPDYQTVQGTSGKSDFFHLAKQFQMAVPPTMEIDLSAGVQSCCDALQAKLDEARAQGLDPQDPSSPVESFRFPLILKSNMSYGYEYLRWPGKKKVYTVTDFDHYQSLLEELEPIAEQHEGMGRFVLQPRIAGNDTHNLSVTGFVNSAGRVSLINSAQVLLEDHSPTALGNPGAMIVQNMAVIEEQAVRFLEGIGWHGFANFDVKVDPNTQTAYFFEVNPRIGRNCYYNNISGVNPVVHLVDDLLSTDFDQRHPTMERAQHPALYYVLPLNLVRRYVDRRIWKKLRQLRKQGYAAHPLFNPAERSFSLRYFRRWLYLKLNQVNHYRKFRRNYPVKVFEQQGRASLDTVGLEG